MLLNQCTLYESGDVISDVDGEDDDDDDEDSEGEEDDTEVGLSYLQKSGLEVLLSIVALQNQTRREQLRTFFMLLSS